MSFFLFEVVVPLLSSSEGLDGDCFFLDSFGFSASRFDGPASLGVTCPFNFSPFGSVGFAGDFFLLPETRLIEFSGEGGVEDAFSVGEGILWSASFLFFLEGPALLDGIACRNSI